MKKFHIEHNDYLFDFKLNNQNIETMIHRKKFNSSGYSGKNNFVDIFFTPLYYDFEKECNDIVENYFRENY